MYYFHVRNYGCRLSTDYSYKGYRVVVLENQFLRISVLADKGTDIFEFLYKPRDVDFMWLSPWGLQSPSSFVSSVCSSGGNFMDFYEGGWQEILPNFGRGVVYRGAEEGLHGEVCLMPWRCEVLEDALHRVAVKFSVRTYRTPFYLEKTLMLNSGEPVLHVHERLRNEGYEAIDFMWTHHPAFGGPFIEGNFVIDVPENKVKFVLTPEIESGDADEALSEDAIWPKFRGYAGKEVDFSVMPEPEAAPSGLDEICIGDLADGWYALSNLDLKVGFGLKWDKEVFPYIWMWRMYGKKAQGYPWWGRVRCLALEISTGYSYRGLDGALKNNTAKRLEPGQEIETSFLALAFEAQGRVAGISQNGKIIG